MRIILQQSLKSIPDKRYKFIKSVERKLPLNLYFDLGGDEFQRS